MCTPQHAYARAREGSLPPEMSSPVARRRRASFDVEALFDELNWSAVPHTEQRWYTRDRLDGVPRRGARRRRPLPETMQRTPPLARASPPRWSPKTPRRPSPRSTPSPAASRRRPRRSPSPVPQWKEPSPKTPRRRSPRNTPPPAPSRRRPRRSPPPVPPWEEPSPSLAW